MPRGKVPKSTAIAKAAKLKKVPEREPFFVIGGMPIYEEMRALKCGENAKAPALRHNIIFVLLAASVNGF